MACRMRRDRVVDVRAASKKKRGPSIKAGTAKPAKQQQQSAVSLQRLPSLFSARVWLRTWRHVPIDGESFSHFSVSILRLACD